MSIPRFSIIIPTRDRARTLRHCLRTVTTQTYADLEIIVSDNCSQDNTREIVESCGDPRIVYLNTGKRVGMSSNWEFALAAARGQWIGFLGDDDGMLPGCFEALEKLAIDTGAQAIRARAASYVWADVVDGRSHAAMNVPIRRGWHWRDSQIWRDRVLAGYQNYSELPMLYNGGFAKKELIDRIKKDLGCSFFHSRIPDVFSGLLLTYYVERFAYSLEPLAVNGTSSYSTGYAQFRSAAAVCNRSLLRGNPQIVDPAKVFASEANLPFHPSIPLMHDGGVPQSILALIYESHAQIAQRLDIAKPLTAEYQIRRILVAQRHFSEEFNIWVKDYDLTNHIRTRTDGIALRLSRLLHRLCFYAYRLGLIWGSYSSYSDDANYPKNIYDASLAAAKIKQLQPRSLSNIVRFVLNSYRRSKATPHS
jgi:glycosyltransferase involved in cell wall biosynthesis